MKWKIRAKKKNIKEHGLCDVRLLHHDTDLYLKHVRTFNVADKNLRPLRGKICKM